VFINQDIAQFKTYVCSGSAIRGAYYVFALGLLFLRYASAATRKHIMVGGGGGRGGGGGGGGGKKIY